ncbi:hypothetical protein OG946_32545 [Streptomyces sp. NBC_01808]|uniref:hypothetical protein n=1 Tax=Streptomyces sp. NBC_01808 TaxID=2975947 RepID=UPI002DD87B01|nr:hypothetical protein [Streptomyces sp. NBC_01808]WSA41687.1 hypothetical protein OG946_32545 [Streptomyces sp. NBC_01808]
MIALPAGFSGSDELDPVTGEWAADGAQPAGLAHFADNATIGVDGGKATLGTPPSSLCGGATVEATGDDRFRIAFAGAGSCVTVNVPVSLDVRVDGDTLQATPAGAPGDAVFRFRRAD